MDSNLDSKNMKELTDDDMSMVSGGYVVGNTSDECDEIARIIHDLRFSLPPELAKVAYEQEYKALRESQTTYGIEEMRALDEKYKMYYVRTAEADK